MIREVLAKGSSVGRDGLGSGRDGIGRSAPTERRGGAKTSEGGLTARQVRGRAQQDIIAAVAQALTRHSYPSLDTGLKSIVAAQLRDLIAGGYDLEIIKRLAISQALQYDDKRGHNRMLHLAAHVRTETESARIAEHMARKRDEAIAAPAVPTTRAELIAQADEMDARGEESWMLRRILAKRSTKVQCPACSAVYFSPGDGSRSICASSGRDHNAVSA